MRAVFGPFSFDLRTLDLTRSEIALRLEEKPARLLACLIERGGQIVTREELRHRLWPEDVNLDFNHGLNKAANKLRAVLGDKTAKPRYIETFSRRGYRFMHPVELVQNAVPATELDKAQEDSAIIVPADASGDSGTSEASAFSLTTAEPEPGHEWPRWRAWLPIAAALAAIVAFVPTAGMLGHLTRVRAHGPKHIRIPPELRLIIEGDGTLALSPDGSRAAFAAVGADRRPRLWLYDFRSARAQELPGTDGGTMPFWSPEGTRLGFFTVFELKTINLSSYSIKTLALTTSPRGGTWSGKGVILFAPETRGPIFRVPDDGGAAAQVTSVDMKSSATTHRWPAFLPDGIHFVYLEANHNAPHAPGKVMLASIDGVRSKFLLESDSNIKASGEDLAFSLHGKLLSTRLNSATQEPDASIQILADGVNCDRGSWYCSFDLNRAGLLYRPRNQVAEHETIAWFDVTGKKIADLGRPGVYRSVDLSPDGKTVAVTCGDPDQRACLFREDGTVTQIDSSGIVSGSIWSPDSSAIAYVDHRSFSEAPFIIRPVSQPSSSRRVTDLRVDDWPIAWHPSGRMFLYERARPGGTYDLGILDMKTGETIPYLPELQSETGMARFSPDGRWVAFNMQKNGTNQIYIASFPIPSMLFPLTTDGGCAAKWRGDGKAIFYLGPGDTLYSVPVSVSSRAFRIGKPAALFRPPIFYGSWNCISFDVSADGRRFVVNAVPDNPAQELVYQAN